MENTRFITVFCLLLLYLALGFLPAAKGSSEDVDRRESEEEELQAACTRPQEVTVREAYLALSDINTRHETMALLLDIDRRVLGNIEKDCLQNNECMYRSTIEAWYNGRPDGKATWDELVSMLKNMEEFELAEYIQFKYLCKTLSEHVIKGGPEGVKNYLIKEFKEMEELFEHYLLLNRPDLEIFKGRLLRILTSLEKESKVTPTEGFVRDFIDSPKIVHLGQIMNFLNTNVWNFFDYELFEIVVRNLTKPKDLVVLKSRLKIYSYHVSQFQNITILNSNIPRFWVWPNQVQSSSNFSIYKKKFKSIPGNTTLEELQRKQAESYSLPSYAFRFAYIYTTCILKPACSSPSLTVAWFVWSNAVPHILQTESRKRNPSQWCKEKGLEYFKVGNKLNNVMCNKHSAREIANNFVFQLINDFESLIDSFEDYFYFNPLDLQKFKHYILHSTVHKDRHLHHNLTDIITNADSVGSIITYLHTYVWNFYEYETFKSVVYACRDKELQLDLEIYTTLMSEYQRRTPLSEFIQLSWPNKLYPAQGFVEYTVKLTSQHPDKVSLKRVVELINKNRYSLPSYAFNLASASFEKECVSITWFIRSEYVQEIMQLESTYYYYNNYFGDLMYLQVGNLTILDNSNANFFLTALCLFPVVMVAIMAVYVVVRISSRHMQTSLKVIMVSLIAAVSATIFGLVANLGVEIVMAGVVVVISMASFVVIRFRILQPLLNGIVFSLIGTVSAIIFGFVVDLRFATVTAGMLAGTYTAALVGAVFGVMTKRSEVEILEEVVFCALFGPSLSLVVVCLVSQVITGGASYLVTCVVVVLVATVAEVLKRMKKEKFDYRMHKRAAIVIGRSVVLGGVIFVLSFLYPISFFTYGSLLLTILARVTVIVGALTCAAVVVDFVLHTMELTESRTTTVKDGVSVGVTNKLKKGKISQYLVSIPLKKVRVSSRKVRLGNSVSK